MNFGLDQEQQMIVDTVRSFVETELYPHEDLVEKSDEVPAELAKEIRDKTKALGFYACNVPEEFGGGGLDAFSFALVERELGRASQALSIHFGRPSNILCACVDDQIDTYLKPAVAGDRIDCLAMTEPDAGSDVRSMKAMAVQDGDDWVINGTKHFITHADIADFVITFVATGEEQTPRGPKKKITAFLIDKGTPGFTERLGYDCVSHRGYNNSILEFDNCRVNKRQILGEVGQGFEVMNEWLGNTRLTVAIMAVGRAMRAYDLAVDWAASRKQFGQQIGKFQGVSFKLADMATEIRGADLMCLETAWKETQGTATDRDFAMAKLYATEMLARVTDNTVQIYGGMGLMEELPVVRFWRDARVERIWDGTSEIQRHIISRSILRELGA